MTTMTATRDVSPIGSLILSWLLTQKDKGTRTALAKATKSLLEQRWSDAEQRDGVDDELATLERAELLTQVKKSRLVLTEEGRRAGLAKLGLAALPGKGDWRTVKQHLLVPALGFSTTGTKGAAKRVLDSSRVCGAILKQHYQLNIGDTPTRTQAIDALVWKGIGGDTGQKLTLKAVRAWFMNQELKSAKPQEPEKAAEQLAAKAVGARRTSANELQLAVFRRWLNGAESAPANSNAASGAEAASTPAVTEKPEPPSDDKAFAAKVLAAARASKTGRFGEDKVFISHVFRRLVSEGAIPDDADAFKDRLISIHRNSDLLSLSRADLVGAMDPKDVDSSEATYLGTTFHFILT